MLALPGVRVVSLLAATAAFGAIASTAAFARTASSETARSDEATEGRIAFFRSVDGSDGGAIWIMNADGTRQRRLTREDDAEPGLTWSPDGRTLAFESFRGGADQSIWVMSAEGRHLRRIPGTKGRIGPAWSPDGRRIALGGILVMNLNGTGKRTVARGWEPTWSPDSRMLAFSRQTKPDYGSSEIFVVGVSGRRERRLTRNGVIDASPAWSPDGRHIAFVRVDRDTASVYVMDADGGNVRRLASGDSPSWSPDGRGLVFSRNFTIWAMRWNGSDQHRIIPRPGRPRLSLGVLSSPQWSPVR